MSESHETPPSATAATITGGQSKKKLRQYFNELKARNYGKSLAWQNFNIGKKPRTGEWKVSKAIDYLPEDVVIRILSLLPVKSLIRFKCVCKSWFAQIGSHSFIAEHLLHANLHKDNGVLLLKVYLNGGDDVSFFLLSEETLEVLEIVHLPQGLSGAQRLRMIGSCNGIVCLSIEYEKYVFLWNPATREIKALQGSAIPGGLCDCSGLYHVSFGFDAKSNDCKVVRSVSFLKKNTAEWTPRQAEIYSLSSDSWRLLNANLPAANINRENVVCLNGICYWQSDSLISFDMSSEVFDSTPFPDMNFVVKLTVVNDSIALVRDVKDDQGRQCFETWVLGEWGVKESWTKVYKFGPVPKFVGKPLGIAKNGGLILLKTEDGQLVLSDYTTSQVKFLQIETSSHQNVEFFSYKESLLSLNSPTEPRSG